MNTHISECDSWLDTPHINLPQENKHICPVTTITTPPISDTDFKVDVDKVREAVRLASNIKKTKDNTGHITEEVIRQLLSYSKPGLSCRVASSYEQKHEDIDFFISGCSFSAKEGLRVHEYHGHTFTFEMYESSIETSYLSIPERLKSIHTRPSWAIYGKADYLVIGYKNEIAVYDYPPIKELLSTYPITSYTTTKYETQRMNKKRKYHIPTLLKIPYILLKDYKLHSFKYDLSGCVEWLKGKVK